MKTENMFEKKLKKSYRLFVFLIFSLHICTANNVNAQKKVEDLKKAFLVQRLNLSSEELTVFWPRFKRYQAEVRKVRKAHWNDELGTEEAVLNVKKKYKNVFFRILKSESRVNQVFVSEKQFRDMLRAELKNRKLKK